MYWNSKNMVSKIVSVLTIVTFLFNNISYAAPSQRSLFKNKKVDYQKLNTQQEENLEKKQSVLRNEDTNAQTHKKESQRILSSHLQDLSQINIPSEYGRVIEVYQAASDKAEETRPLVVHIQDLHTNPEAELNLANILETLVKDYNLGLVCSEGADGEVDTSSVSSFPDYTVREKTARLFINSGELTGEEYLSITKYPDLAIWGIEDRDIYFRNIVEFNNIMKFNASSQVFISQAKDTLEGLKPKVYSKELLALDALQKEYEGKTIDTDKYLEKLTSYIHGFDIDSSNYKNIALLRETIKEEKAINQGKILQESQDLLLNLRSQLSSKSLKADLDALMVKSELFKDQKISPFSFYSFLKDLALKHIPSNITKYPDLNNFIGYLTKVNSIDTTKLFNEMEGLSYEVKNRIARSDEEKALIKALRNIDFLEGFFNLKISNEELDYYLANKDTFTVTWFKSTITDLTNSTDLTNYVDFNPSLIDPHLQELEDFYKTVKLRDLAMVDNSLSEIEKRGSKVSALIAGGFHTKGITKLLKEKGYSYIVISPYSSTDIDEENYHFLLSGKRKPISELIEQFNSTLRIIAAFTKDPTFFEESKAALAEAGISESSPIVNTKTRMLAFYALAGAQALYKRTQRINTALQLTDLLKEFTPQFYQALEELGLTIELRESGRAIHIRFKDRDRDEYAAIDKETGRLMDSNAGVFDTVSDANRVLLAKAGTSQDEVISRGSLLGLLEAFEKMGLKAGDTIASKDLLSHRPNISLARNELIDAAKIGLIEETGNRQGNYKEYRVVRLPGAKVADLKRDAEIAKKLDRGRVRQEDISPIRRALGISTELTRTVPAVVSQLGLSAEILERILEDAKKHHGDKVVDYTVGLGISGMARGSMWVVKVLDSSGNPLQSYLVKYSHTLYPPWEVERSKQASNLGLGPRVIDIGPTQNTIVEEYHPETSIRERGSQLTSEEWQLVGRRFADKIYTMADVTRHDRVVHRLDSWGEHIRVIGQGKDIDVIFIDWGRLASVDKSNRSYILSDYIHIAIDSFAPEAFASFMDRLTELAGDRSEEELGFFMEAYENLRLALIDNTDSFKRIFIPRYKESFASADNLIGKKGIGLAASSSDQRQGRSALEKGWVIANHILVAFHAAFISSILSLPRGEYAMEDVLRFVFASPETIISVAFWYMTFHVGVWWHERGHYWQHVAGLTLRKDLLLEAQAHSTGFRRIVWELRMFLLAPYGLFPGITRDGLTYFIEAPYNLKAKAYGPRASGRVGRVMLPLSAVFLTAGLAGTFLAGGGIIGVLSMAGIYVGRLALGIGAVTTLDRHIADPGEYDKYMAQEKVSEEKAISSGNWLEAAPVVKAKMQQSRLQEAMLKGGIKLRAPWGFRNCAMGGRHTEKEYPESNISFQEGMFIPISARNQEDAQEMTVRLQQQLKTIIDSTNGCRVMGVGLEGGLAAFITPEKGDIVPEQRMWRLMKQAIEECGYNRSGSWDVVIAFDPAASELEKAYKNKEEVSEEAAIGQYYFWRYRDKPVVMSREQMLDLYRRAIEDEAIPIVSIEDGFSEHDWDGWRLLLNKYGDKLFIIGDDLVTTNDATIEKAQKEGAINTALIKANQIGTLSETVLAMLTAVGLGFDLVVSHRSKSPNDDMEAQIALASMSTGLKAGGGANTERLMKYHTITKVMREALLKQIDKEQGSEGAVRYTEEQITQMLNSLVITKIIAYEEPTNAGIPTVGLTVKVGFPGDERFGSLMSFSAATPLGTSAGEGEAVHLQDMSIERSALTAKYPDLFESAPYEVLKFRKGLTRGDIEGKNDEDLIRLWEQVQRFSGQGVQNAARYVEEILSPAFVGKSASELGTLVDIDRKLLEIEIEVAKKRGKKVDDPVVIAQIKSNIGMNGILSLSLALARFKAAVEGVEPFQVIRQTMAETMAKVIAEHDGKDWQKVYKENAYEGLVAEYKRVSAEIKKDGRSLHDVLRKHLPVYDFGDTVMSSAGISPADSPSTGGTIGSLLGLILAVNLMDTEGHIKDNRVTIQDVKPFRLNYAYETVRTEFIDAVKLGLLRRTGEKKANSFVYEIVVNLTPIQLDKLPVSIREKLNRGRIKGEEVIEIQEALLGVMSPGQREVFLAAIKETIAPSAVVNAGQAEGQLGRGEAKEIVLGSGTVKNIALLQKMAEVKRRPVIGGNWKMAVGSVSSAQELLRGIAEQAGAVEGVDVVVLASPVHLGYVASALKILEDTGQVPKGRIKVGAQNIWAEEKGAYTSGVSAEQVVDLGGSYALLGHSEVRRNPGQKLTGESNQNVNRKLKTALKYALTPIVCVGESLEERESGKTEELIERMVRESLAGISSEEAAKVIIAYEPVWAIGTGKTATKEQANETISFIRGVLASMFGEETASKVRIQYGGSVNETNTAGLISQPHIDGALVGGASLKPESFGSIIKQTAAVQPEKPLLTILQPELAVEEIRDMPGLITSVRKAILTGLDRGFSIRDIDQALKSLLGKQAEISVTGTLISTPVGNSLHILRIKGLEGGRFSGMEDTSEFTFTVNTSGDFSGGRTPHTWLDLGDSLATTQRLTEVTSLSDKVIVVPAAEIITNKNGFEAWVSKQPKNIAVVIVAMPDEYDGVKEYESVAHIKLVGRDIAEEYRLKLVELFGIYGKPEFFGGFELGALLKLDEYKGVADTIGSGV